jgi:hypothetical protein
MFEIQITFPDDHTGLPGQQVTNTFTYSVSYAPALSSVIGLKELLLPLVSRLAGQGLLWLDLNVGTGQYSIVPEELDVPDDLLEQVLAFARQLTLDSITVSVLRKQDNA